MASIEWLPDRTKDWPFVPIALLGTATKNKNIGMKETNLLSLSYGRVIRKDINAIEGLRPASYETYQIVEPGDTILRFTDLQNDKNSLRSGFVTERGIMTSAYVNFRPDPRLVNPRFFALMMRTVDQKKVFYRMGSGVRQSLNYAEFSTLAIPLPDLDTQRRIADYLDTETTQIDAMMAKLDKQVELLEERYDRLKTDLPSPINSSVKDQTINGEYREGWSVKPLQSLFRRKKVLGHVDEPMVSVFKQHGVVFKDDYENLNRTANDRSIYQLVDRGWFVVNRMKAWSGSVGVSTIRGISSGHYICFEPFHEESDEYLNLVLRSRGARDWYFKFSRGVRPGQAEIDNQWLLQLPVPLPPLDEQRRIVAELDEKTSRIDTMIAKCEELKTLLQERRAALITAVVTGQKEVPSHD